MNILGIETSCDETSCAVVAGGRKILSSVVSSQIPIHRKYSGVVPELASRAHIENVNAVLDEALDKAGIRDIAGEISAIAYTRGPGLAGSLLVGQITAQTLSSLYRLPLIDVNHIEGHLYAPLLKFSALKPPYLALVVSGGHTELIVVKDFGNYTYLGGTRDDAAGEAFDKVAKLLGLGYPGGPVIDVLAKKGDPKAVRFPRPLLPGTWEFSFSGLKTAVVNYVNNLSIGHCEPRRGVAISSSESNRLLRSARNDVCASFQAAVVDTLAEKTFAAAGRYGLKTIVVGGGVAANSSLRTAFTARGKREKRSVFLPPLDLCTDNAAMVACTGYYRFKRGRVEGGLQRIEPGMKLKNWNEKNT